MKEIQEIIDDLINAQPHIAECHNASFIDDHINAAIKKLRSLDHSIESSATQQEYDEWDRPI